ncbi:hypothetical protein [Methanococcus maripaludis]|nr:hypothetical protein [Methanococcus maripaludis]
MTENTEIHVTYVRNFVVLRKDEKKVCDELNEIIKKYSVKNG